MSAEQTRTAAAEAALIEQIKTRIAFHANEHRQTYEVGKGVMDYLARDLLADFRAAGFQKVGMTEAKPAGWSVPSRPREKADKYPEGQKVIWEIKRRE